MRVIDVFLLVIRTLIPEKRNSPIFSSLFVGCVCVFFYSCTRKDKEKELYHTRTMTEKIKMNDIVDRDDKEDVQDHRTRSFRPRSDWTHCSIDVSFATDSSMDLALSPKHVSTPNQDKIFQNDRIVSSPIVCDSEGNSFDRWRKTNRRRRSFSFTCRADRNVPRRLKKKLVRSNGFR